MNFDWLEQLYHERKREAISEIDSEWDEKGFLWHWARSKMPVIASNEIT
jgi:hypothetical protein